MNDETPHSSSEARWETFMVVSFSFHHLSTIYVVLPYLNSVTFPVTFYFSGAVSLPLSPFNYFQIHHAFVSCKGLRPYLSFTATFTFAQD
jgi:hypothetical protein